MGVVIYSVPIITWRRTGWRQSVQKRKRLALPLTGTKVLADSAWVRTDMLAKYLRCYCCSRLAIYQIDCIPCCRLPKRTMFVRRASGHANSIPAITILAFFSIHRLSVNQFIAGHMILLSKQRRLDSKADIKQVIPKLASCNGFMQDRQ